MQHAMLMRIFAGASILAVLLCGSADAQRRRDQDEAFAARRAGQVMPLNQIEQNIVPRMGGASYLGPEFDAGSATYRLKFMRGGSVIWIDIDGRTGQIVGRSGN